MMNTFLTDHIWNVFLLLHLNYIIPYCQPVHTGKAHDTYLNRGIVAWLKMAFKQLRIAIPRTKKELRLRFQTRRENQYNVFEKRQILLKIIWYIVYIAKEFGFYWFLKIVEDDSTLRLWYIISSDTADIRRIDRHAEGFWFNKSINSGKH